jgi:4-amino-4-deoxy-L-arabinose transferase-like glycosyltransferase
MMAEASEQTIARSAEPASPFRRQPRRSAALSGRMLYKRAWPVARQQHKFNIQRRPHSRGMTRSVENLTKALARNWDFALVAAMIAGFVFVAAQRLGAVPVPDSDEAMTLQVPYEMMYRGKLAFPMYSFLGGNIENVWHSYTPVFFLALTGFMKIFGWGLAQGRAFNLITAATLLLMVYAISRRVSGWQTGLIAVALMISDPVFFARSRLARNDMLAASFGLLAFYLYDKAQEQDKKSWFFATGIAAGAAVMCHTNLIYMLAVIFALMLMKGGWRVIKTSRPYLFAAGAFAVSAYEIIYDIIDYRNFISQNQRDTIHFRILEPLGWLKNIAEEPARYARWFEARGLKLAPEAMLLRLFLILAAAALVYLAALFAIHLKSKNLANDSRLRVFAATMIAILFFAVVTQRKTLHYAVHLSPWLALSAGIFVADAIRFLKRLRDERWPRLAYPAAMAVLLIAASAFGYFLIKQNRSYLQKARNPDLADFEEIKAALRAATPEDVCPASIGSAYLWLAFPEYDQCYFAHMEARLDQPLDLDGKEYALIIRPRYMKKLKKLTGGIEKYRLIGELKKTAYGTFRIYYTGLNPRYLEMEPKRFQFFGQRRGYTIDEPLSPVAEK